MYAPPLALIAVPAGAEARLSSALEDELRIAVAHTYDEAVQRLHDTNPDILIVGYFFDESRPFRFIGYVRQSGLEKRLPIVLVRVLPLPLPLDSEADIQHAYRNLGADEFFSFYEEEQRRGTASAIASFRERVLRYFAPAAEPRHGAE